MDEAKDYKKNLKALKKVTKKSAVKEIDLGDVKDFLQRRKILAGGKSKFSCGGMGIAVKGGKFEGVK